MDYKELTKRVMNGEFVNGDTFWVVDYRHNDINNKAIRHQPPIQVALDCGDIPEVSRYNSSVLNALFYPILRNGKLGSKKISPFDNTAYSSNYLCVFLDKESALEKYKEQCDVIEKEIDKGRNAAIAYFDRLEEDLNKKRAAQGI